MTEHGPSPTLWFLAPGLAHLLGNALFTLQGRARLLAGAQGQQAQRRPEGVQPERSPHTATQHVDDDVRAIHEGAERAQAGLHLLRWLIGEGGIGPVPAATVLHTLVDVARVPLRDRGVALELVAGGEPAAAHVDAPTCCRWVTAMCRELAGSLHGTAPVRMSLAWEAEPGSVRVSCRLAAESGGPPLAREADLAAQALRTAFAAAEVRWESADGGATLVAIMPGARATFRVP